EGVYSPRLVTGFNAWLRTQYADTNALAGAWGGLNRGESLEDGTIGLPGDRYMPSPRYRDVQRYFIEAEIAGTAAMTAMLRNMGYQGAITNFNNWPILQANLSRRDLEAVTMNTYFDWVGGYSPGERIEQQSSIGQGLDYIRLAASARWLGRPFLVTEYDHLFWNRYRYEAGLAMPAYAAFQGWDGLCRHGHGPIALRYGEDAPHKRQMLPYAIALDPVARAGETLAALLFRRGDVAPSELTIPFAIDGEHGLTDAIQATEPEDLTGLMALGSIGLEAGAGEGIFVPAVRTETSFGDMVGRLLSAGSVDQQTADALGQGVYRSDTGQIEVLPDRRLLTVVTPRTVAAAFESIDGELALGPVIVRASTTPALFALSALDGEPLADSQRILVIFATDARNSGMRFGDSEAREILDFGELPVLIQPGNVDFRLEGTGNWSIAAVGLDGVVKSIMHSGNGDIDLRLANGTPDGPTTYFVIERD
ncbi:MAG TPA: glycoside hydrolase, partial [Devosia sp.]|nr:glycoside hydrolase [Devosia sp.]